MVPGDQQLASEVSHPEAVFSRVHLEKNNPPVDAGCLYAHTHTLTFICTLLNWKPDIFRLCVKAEQISLNNPENRNVASQ